MEEIPNEFDIIVKTLSNDVHHFKISTEITIAEFKELIAVATNVDVERQRLIYRGKVLLNENVIKEYNIESGHTVHMVAKPLNLPPSATQAASEPPQSDAAYASNENLSSSAGSSENLATGNTNSLEHIRQGLLSIHTLISTMNPSEFSYCNSTNGLTSSSYRQMNRQITLMDEAPLKDFDGNVIVALNGDAANCHHSKRQVVDKSLRTGTEKNTDLPLRDDKEEATAIQTKRFFRGQWIDVKDTVSQWLEATVMDIDHNEQKIFVHYNGWY